MHSLDKSLMYVQGMYVYYVQYTVLSIIIITKLNLCPLFCLPLTVMQIYGLETTA